MRPVISRFLPAGGWVSSARSLDMMEGVLLHGATSPGGSTLQRTRAVSLDRDESLAGSREGLHAILCMRTSCTRWRSLGMASASYQGFLASHRKLSGDGWTSGITAGR